MAGAFKAIFHTPIENKWQYFVIFIMAAAYIFIQQVPPSDWVLNTSGFWSNFPHSYDNPNIVYPPWGLILMVPYWLMRAEGARFFSVLVIGWLAKRQRWTLSRFFAILLSPYFIGTLTKSNMDILVFVFPILLWEAAKGTRWQPIGWGLALSILLLKPQGAVLLWLYFFWNTRKEWKQLLLPLGITALVTVPISLVGSPPLLFQWLDNILNPSEQNRYFWSINNFSLTYYLPAGSAVLLLLLIALLFVLLVRYRKLTWTKNHTMASLLLVSMFLSPYASQQSLSSPLAFLPSWGANLIQAVVMISGVTLYDFHDYQPYWVLFLALIPFLLYTLQKQADQAGAVLDKTPQAAGG